MTPIFYVYSEAQMGATGFFNFFMDMEIPKMGFITVNFSDMDSVCFFNGHGNPI